MKLPFSADSASSVEAQELRPLQQLYQQLLHGVGDGC